MTDFSSRAEAIRRLTEVELDAILLREVCHSRQNWQRDGDWHDWIEISPDERERLVAAAKSVARLTAQVETLQGEQSNLVRLEAAYRANEQLALRKLSDALTSGNASTWDHIFEAAETLQGERDEAVRRIPTEQTTNDEDR